MLKPRGSAGLTRRARWVRRVLLALAGSLVLCGVAAYPYVTGRADPPTAERLAAERSLAAAREASAAHWARDELAGTEATMLAARAEERRQQLAFFLVRDYAGARVLFERARLAAAATAEQATSERDQARTAAEQAVAGARRTLGHAEDLLDGIRLLERDRDELRSARAQLVEAEVFLGAEAYARAVSRAEGCERAARQALAGAGAMAARFVDRDQVARWHRWVEDTIAWSRRKGAAAIVVIKDERRVDLYRSGRRVHSYDADLGPNVVAAKTRAGDRSTPEGRYKITQKKDLGASRYHKALLLDYPNEEDLRQFRELKAKGVLAATARPGSLIEIHGEGGRGEDWTLGCVALTNGDMDHLFERVAVGTPVTIVGGNGRSGPLTELALHAAGGGNGSSP